MKLYISLNGINLTLFGIPPHRHQAKVNIINPGEFNSSKQPLNKWAE